MKTEKRGYTMSKISLINPIKKVLNLFNQLKNFETIYNYLDYQIRYLKGNSYLLAINKYTYSLIPYDQLTNKVIRNLKRCKINSYFKIDINYFYSFSEIHGLITEIEL